MNDIKDVLDAISKTLFVVNRSEIMLVRIVDNDHGLYTQQTIDKVQEARVKLMTAYNYMNHVQAELQTLFEEVQA